MADVDDIRSRLETIAEELADLALDALREAVESRRDQVRDRAPTDPGPNRRLQGRPSPGRVISSRTELELIDGVDESAELAGGEAVVAQRDAVEIEVVVVAHLGGEGRNGRRSSRRW